MRPDPQSTAVATTANTTGQAGAPRSSQPAGARVEPVPGLRDLTVAQLQAELNACKTQLAESEKSVSGRMCIPALRITLAALESERERRRPQGH
eukprot:1179410-Amphidinium_carterae.1